MTPSGISDERHRRNVIWLETREIKNPIVKWVKRIYRLILIK